MNIITFTKKDLTQFLNITENNLKTIEKRSGISDRLLKNNLRLIESKIISNKKVYICSVITNINLEEFCVSNNIKRQNIFKIKELISILSNYIKSETKISKKEMMLLSNSSKRSIDNFTNILIKEKYMKRAGYFYIKLHNKIEEETSKESYTSYWKKHVTVKKELNELKIQLKNNIISEEDYDNLHIRIVSKLKEKGPIFYRIRKFKKGQCFDEFLKMLDN